MKMNLIEQQKGAITLTPEVTLLDTREMEWEPYPGLEGSFVKVLSRFENGEPSVFILLMPAGFKAFSGRHRHYHATSTEYHFILTGEQPTWLYANAEQRDGDMHILKEGHYLERRPGPNGLHGTEEGGPPRITGCTMLIWRDRTGNFIHEPDADEETISVPYPDEPAT
jgi:hypothetical protein